MASVSTGHLLMFIIALVITSSATGVLANEVERIGDVVERTSFGLREGVGTDVEIIGDPGTDVYNDSTENVTVFVKNVGPRPIPTDGGKLTVLVDGEAYSDVAVTAVDGEEWQPGDVARVDVDTGSLSVEEHTVTVVVNGDREVLHDHR